MPKKRRKKIKKKKLPNRLLVFKNKNKNWHETWTKNRARDPLNIPHPARIVICGEPNIGKGNIAKNLLLHQKPSFERMVVISEDPETREFDDVDAEILGKIPPGEFFDRDQKTLVLIDDVDLKGRNNKIQNHRLMKIFSNWSTHRNITVILCTQDFYECPVIVRRCSNVVILGKSKDETSRKTISQKIGLTVDKLNRLYNRNVRGQFDTIWFDLTRNTPYPFRANGFTILNMEQ